MKRSHIQTVILAAALAIGCGALLAPAEGILDQQLGPAPADAKPPEKPKADAPHPDGAPKPDSSGGTARENAPPGQEIVNPEAAKAVDDADLVHKLTGDAPSTDDPSAKMKEMIERMQQSQSRLDDKDAGAVTQETQRRIISDLDVMIEYARKQQQSGKGSGKQQKQEPGQKRQMSQGQQQGQQQSKGNQAAQDSYVPTGGVAAAESNGEDMHQKGPQEWGNLPARDRDLISNGASEQYLPSYKELIDRYYQALAEVGKSSKEHP